jgi:signal peptidase I
LLDVVRAVVGAGGSLWVRVTGVSMNPMLRDGDSVLLARLARPARRGDVLFVDVGGRPVLHRVRRIDSGLIVTRGDAALTDDPAVPPAACVAHALAVRRGPVTVALSPTFRFGAMPLLWLAAWTIRVRVPRSLDRGVKPLSRAIARALS